MHSGWMSGDWSQMSPLMGFVMLLFIGLVAYCLYTAVSSLWGNNKDDHEPSPGETELDRLKSRYAAGEINQDEFERIKKGLK